MKQPLEVVFWTDQGQTNGVRQRPRDDAKKRVKWLRSELLAGRLGQGWGYEGCDLSSECDALPSAGWLANYKTGFSRSWDRLPTNDEAIRRYRILARMKILRPGDLIVIPRMPDKVHMALAPLVGEYLFDPAALPFDAPNPICYCHVLGLDPSAISIVSYGASLDAALVRSRFSRYRSAVSLVARADDETSQAIRRLWAAPV